MFMVCSVIGHQKHRQHPITRGSIGGAITTRAIMDDLRAGIGQKTLKASPEAPHPLPKPTGHDFCRRLMRRWCGWGEGLIRLLSP